MVTVIRYLRLNPVTMPPDRYKDVFDFLSSMGLIGKNCVDKVVI